MQAEAQRPRDWEKSMKVLAMLPRKIERSFLGGNLERFSGNESLVKPLCETLAFVMFLTQSLAGCAMESFKT